MSDLYNSLSTSTRVVNECLIVTLPNYIADDDIKVGINRILNREVKPSIKGVILDLSLICALDSYGFMVLERSARTFSLMGFKVVWVGFSSGVVSSLLDLKVDVSCIKAAMDLEQGISIILDATN